LFSGKAIAAYRGNIMVSFANCEMLINFFSKKILSLSSSQPVAVFYRLCCDISRVTCL